MLFDRRFLRFFDWISFFLILFLLLLGLISVYSATYTPSIPFSPFFKKQLWGSLSGLIIYFIFCSIDLYTLMRYAVGAYGITLLFLIYARIAGRVAMGGQRWISLYIFRFQPAELARLFLPAFIASCFTENSAHPAAATITSPSLFTLSVLAFTFVLILKQPDLGSALIILFSGGIMLWVAGLEKKIMITLGLCALVATPVLWKMLRPYQKQRILVVFGYGEDRKERYHIEQSKIAIGSGGLFGKGFLKGTQNKFEFLPEDHTDFIFSVICEEWGLAGALFLLLIFLILFSRIIATIMMLTDPNQQIIALGLVVHIMLSVCINIGMVTGLLPIVGIPLPLISYGLTNLWITLASLGWINNIAIHHYYR